jgi:hypothetical protein
MSGDFEPRDFDARDRDDGIHDRIDHTLNGTEVRTLSTVGA